MMDSWTKQNKSHSNIIYALFVPFLLLLQVHQEDPLLGKENIINHHK